MKFILSLLILLTCSIAFAKPYGAIVTENFGIADVRIGSRDADRSSTSTYTAPTGYRILGHKIHKAKGSHHSGVSHLKTYQPGQLSYQNKSMVKLYDSIRKGFAKGLLNDGKKKKGGSAAANYAKFTKEFSAKYMFIANTHAKITFKWFVDSKSYDHGAKLKANAAIRLEKVGTQEDILRATEIIKFVIESGESANVYKLMEIALKEDPKG